MQKTATSIGRLLVAAGFPLSCFALLLFLWVTFGGPVPFKPASYRFTADFPEAITLQKEADGRIGGGRGGGGEGARVCGWAVYTRLAWRPRARASRTRPPATRRGRR